MDQAKARLQDDVLRLWTGSQHGVQGRGWSRGIQGTAKPEINGSGTSPYEIKNSCDMIWKSPWGQYLDLSKVVAVGDLRYEGTLGPYFDIWFQLSEPIKAPQLCDDLYAPKGVDREFCDRWRHDKVDLWRKELISKWRQSRGFKSRFLNFLGLWK